MFLWTGIVALLCVFNLSYAKVLEYGCVDRNKITGPFPSKVIEVRSKGNLYSPGYQQKENYPDNVQCSYQLLAPTGMHVRLHFNELDIDTTESCESDSLQILDFNTTGEGYLIPMPPYHMCGDKVPYDYVSQSFAVTLVLKTDIFGTKRGFNITYSAQVSPKVCRAKELQCGNRKCVDYALRCDGNDDCGDGTDEEKCYARVPTSECGKPEIDHVASTDIDRIVGGVEATQGSWPWMADLQERLVEPNGHFCGGSLITAQWVLTAAHCFEELRSPEEIRIHLGNHHKFKTDEYEQVRYAERVIIYDDIPSSIFESNGIYDIVNDVALIKLNAPVKFTKYVKPVCLPGPDFKLDSSSNCYHSGWGESRGTGKNDVLKQAVHPVQDDVNCIRLVEDAFEPKTMICAGSMAALHGACHGDSGGPLMCEAEKGKWTIVGVASYGTHTNMLHGLCGVKAGPTIFNRISVKNSWIQRMVNKYS